MKISQKLPQFDSYPTLFLVAGEMEAHFLVARDGEITEKAAIAFDPREEAKEKQGFISKGGGGQDFGAVSHHERYMEDLKMKVHRAVREMTTDILRDEDIREICVIAPNHSAHALISSLDTEAKQKIVATIYGLHTKKNPLQIIELFDREIKNMFAFATHRHAINPTFIRNGV